MGVRCAIMLHASHEQDACDVYVSMFTGKETILERYIRAYGSRSEAKRELAKWLLKWPGVKIVDEVDL
jgi:hypothetical protein